MKYGLNGVYLYELHSRLAECKTTAWGWPDALKCL